MALALLLRRMSKTPDAEKGTFALSDAPKLMHYWRLRYRGHLVCRWHRCQARCGSGLAVAKNGDLKSTRFPGMCAEIAGFGGRARLSSDANSTGRPRRLHRGSQLDSWGARSTQLDDQITHAAGRSWHSLLSSGE